MTPKTFFTIVLKIMGLVYIVEILIVLPGFFSSMYSLLCTPSYGGGMDIASVLIGCLIAIAVIAFFIIVIRSFLFKTDYLIAKLKLEKNFGEDKIDFNLPAASIITIASIVTGAIIVVDALPLFCRNVFLFLQNLRQYAFITDNPSAYYIVEYGVKLALGYLLINNSRRVAEWLVKKQNIS